MVTNVAKLQSSLIPAWLWPGLAAASVMLTVAVVTLLALWFGAAEEYSATRSITLLLQDHYLLSVIQFTFYQALLSALLSLALALPLALALYRRRFFGRTIFLRLCAMTLVLPVLVVVFGLTTIYGRQGWLAHITTWIGVDYQFSIYGLSGILLAHIFFNFPLATRLLLQSLEAIPIEQRQLAAQLGMDTWQKFRLIELPAILRQLFPCGALIFMLCFASFATVLALGGGPQATTIEVAIYQALHYDFNLTKAAILALIQLVCCLSILLLSYRFTHTMPVGHTFRTPWREQYDGILLRWSDMLIITLSMLFLLPPLLAIIVEGLNSTLVTTLQHPLLWQAVSTSFLIAFCSALLGITLSLMLIWSSRELYLRHFFRSSRLLELSGLITLAMPSLVIATGFFLLLLNTTGLPDSPFFIIVLVNTLIAIPYTSRILNSPMRDLAERYQYLYQSLGIRGINRLYHIELPAIKRPLAQAFAFACVLSLGDFSIIALFGSDEFITLPLYLYEQLGAYRSKDGAVTALLLFLICFIFYSFIEQLVTQHDQT